MVLPSKAYSNYRTEGGWKLRSDRPALQASNHKYLAAADVHRRKGRNSSKKGTGLLAEREWGLNWLYSEHCWIDWVYNTFCENNVNLRLTKGTSSNPLMFWPPFFEGLCSEGHLLLSHSDSNCFWSPNHRVYNGEERLSDVDTELRCRTRKISSLLTGLLEPWVRYQGPFRRLLWLSSFTSSIVVLGLSEVLCSLDLPQYLTL